MCSSLVRTHPQTHFTFHSRDQDHADLSGSDCSHIGRYDVGLHMDILHDSTVYHCMYYDSEVSDEVHEASAWIVHLHIIVASGFHHISVLSESL